MSGAPAFPTAPPAGFYDTVPGYEGTLAGGGGFLPPPMPSAPLPVADNLPAQTNWNITSITEQAAREAFMSYASSKCCYSTAPVKDGVITNLEPFNTYRYRLETFTETRSSEWSHEPYTGQPVDASIQPAPAPWAITAQTPAFFQDQTQTIRVPYTSAVKRPYILDTYHCPKLLTKTYHCPKPLLKTYGCPKLLQKTYHCPKPLLKTYSCPKLLPKTCYCPKLPVETYHCPKLLMETYHCPKPNIK